MSIYLHIPFCKQACHYCDFHFSTLSKSMTAMVEAMCQEIALQRNFFDTQVPLQSIYFGGGTPSLLNEAQLAQLLQHIHQYFSIDTKAEITLEANPDDLNHNYLQMLKRQGVNRLSIGIQSFHEAHLRYTNRAHKAQEAIDAVKMAQDIGFQNISIDLIYGIPADTHDILYHDLAQAQALQVPHISCYCLTIEPKTVFGNWLKHKKIQPIDEQFAAEQFDIVINSLTQNGFEQYEISNFAVPPQYSQHNTNYWKKGNYLGIGASAHSYNGTQRQYNVANNQAYIKTIAQGKIPCEVETLSRENHINEYLMTSLRTVWGCDLNFLREKYHYDLLNDHENRTYLEKGIAREWFCLEHNTLRLLHKGKFFADEIAANFFVV